jgi:uncharacterized OB-fold protein
MSAGPIPASTPETAPYWEGTAVGELRIQKCVSCQEFYFYPRPFCPRCLSPDVVWTRVSGHATLASYVINYRPLPQFETEDPQIIALVNLAEGPRLMTNLVGIPPDPDLLTLGMPLIVQFEARGDMWLPVFAPREDA